jgi:hypothetical protein
MIRQIQHWINEYHFRRSFKVAESKSTLEHFQVPVNKVIELNTLEGNEYLRQEILRAKIERGELFVKVFLSMAYA